MPDRLTPETLREVADKALHTDGAIRTELHACAAQWEQDLVRIEALEKKIDISAWFYENCKRFYNNCKRQRRNEARVCQVCPFREGIEAQERAALDKGRSD